MSTCNRGSRRNRRADARVVAIDDEYRRRAAKRVRNTDCETWVPRQRWFDRGYPRDISARSRRAAARDLGNSVRFAVKCWSVEWRSACKDARIRQCASEKSDEVGFLLGRKIERTY